MGVYMFFDKICFGENGYPVSLTEINEFINSHKNNLLSLKHDAIKFESKTIAEKYNKEKGNSEPIYRIKDQNWLINKCGMWVHFLNELERQINKNYIPDSLDKIYERICFETGSIRVFIVENGQTKKIYYRNKRDNLHKKNEYDNISYSAYLLRLQTAYVEKINFITDTNLLKNHFGQFNIIMDKLNTAHSFIWSYMPDGYSIMNKFNDQFPDFKLKPFLLKLKEMLNFSESQDISIQPNHKIENNPEILLKLSDEIEMNISTITNLIAKIKPSIPEQQENNLIGFKTTLTEPQQSKLFKALQNNYIDCTEAEFKAIFTNNPKPIKWLIANILLAYFVSNCKKITDNSKWKKASQIFGTKDNLQQSLNNNPYPKGHNELQEILNSIE